MPNTTSAMKRVRQNARRQALNHWRKRRIKDQIKTFLKAVQEQDVKAAEGEYRRACSILDKIACTSTLHRNTASRRKARLARRLNALKSGAA